MAPSEGDQISPSSPRLHQQQVQQHQQQQHRPPRASDPSSLRSHSITLEPLSIAYYCTGHGLGHATRAIEVCKHLVARGHTVTVVTGAPARVFLQQVPSARFTLRKAVLDCGSKQLDPFTVDTRGSLEEYHNTAVLHREELLAAEVSWLRTTHTDLVVSDVVPIACAAAAQAGIPAVAVTNFSWDFIYSEYLTAQRRTEFRQLVWQIAWDYGNAALLLRLPGHVPMPAFQAVEDVPLVVRKARRPPHEVRAELGLSSHVRIAVLIYGGHRAELTVREDFLPQGWACVICNGGKPLGPEQLPPNFLLAPADAYTPDLVAAGDCVIGKIGYGTMSECLAHAKPLVFVRRDFFNEEPFLRKMLELHNAAVEMKRRDFFDGHWGPYLLRAAAMTVQYTEPTNGAEVVARRLEDIGRGGASPAPTPLQRMKDTIVFGYLMAAAKEARVDVPEWYVSGTDPNRRLASSMNVLDSIGAASRQLLATWDLIEGSFDHLQQLPDTVAFLQLLADLDAAPTAAAASTGHHHQGGPLPRVSSLRGGAAGGGGGGSSLERSRDCSADGGRTPRGEGAVAPAALGMGPGLWADAELPEKRAAKGLFRWDDDIIVARAPGRLDVMGGIADYSGSLVLQMPIAEACHVALQRHPLDKQVVWRHMQARHSKLGGPRPALRVVSYHADTTNRSPTFDIDIDDLYETHPETGVRSLVSYSRLRDFFRSDPAISWGGYVAGCLLVLAREKGAVFNDGVSLLICSDVPEGKGVSSSAALEVSVMTALAAAHDIELGGRELALLCQKVENLVVGAPCGIMDQMTAALGGAGQLLALLCQPAEVVAHVPIPQQVRFWGIDSGIRHFVGGADYGSVRVGTFMGRAMLRDLAAQEDAGGGGNGTGGGGGAGALVPRAARELLLGGAGGRQKRQGDGGSGGGGGPALVNLPPSLFKEVFEQRLPVTVTGAKFLERWGSHGDDITRVEAEVSYAVRIPTGHPIYEHARVSHFKALLEAPDLVNDAAAAAKVALASAGGADGGEGADDGAGNGSDAAAANGGGVARSLQSEPVSCGSSACGDAGSGSNGSAAAAPAPRKPPCAPALAPLGGPLELLGELMFQSHASYTACGLGSDGTSRFVNLVREHIIGAAAAGAPPALYGAKITGGGSGGAVCVMGLAGGPGQAAVAAVAEQYERETGHTPAVFSGSSMGATRLGALRLRRRFPPPAPAPAAAQGAEAEAGGEERVAVA